MAPARGWLELAELIQQHSQDPHRALEACDRALERDPQLAEALALRAELHAAFGNTRRELEDRLRLGELLPDGPDAADSLAHAGHLARQELGDDVQAWMLFRAALKKDPASLAGLAGAGEIALERGEWSEAERMFGLACSLLRATGDAERLAEVARLAAEAASRQERNAEAFRYLELALQEDPQHPRALDGMAELSLRLGAPDRARHCLETRLSQSELSPGERAFRLVRLAEACEQGGDLARAASCLEEVVEIWPEDEGVRLRALDLLESLGESQRAIRQIEAWLDRVPSEQKPELVLRAARIEAGAGQRDAARERLATLLEQAPGLAAAWADLARIAADDQGPEAALEVTQRGLGTLEEPIDRAALLWVEAGALEGLKQIPEATERAGQALAADPSNLEAAQMLAANLGQARDFRGAVNQLERTLDVVQPSAPVEAELWEALGRAYAGPLEDIERAERCYRRALDCNPLGASAREALADITAFDPAAHRESLRQHLDLLEAFPARVNSWRSLARIASHWKREHVTQTCDVVLDTLGVSRLTSGDDPLPPPLVNVQASAHPVVCGATELLLALEEGGLLPQAEEDPVLGPLPRPIAEAIEGLAGKAWKLSDDTLHGIWCRPFGEGEAGSIPRRARRRIRRALRSFDLVALGDLQPELWREEIFAQAAAVVVSEGKLWLGDALLHILRLWPATSHLDLRSGGDLGAVSQLCPPARTLLLRVSDAVVEGIGLTSPLGAN
jgi:tetratricopeptide (TPR) repeat protein